MPKTIIDYSNTIIYKISCKDQTITDLYVGHTTNFVQRKHAHKQSCINMKSINYKCKLYEVIRNNGGWSNWQMDIINFYNCKNHYEARQKEQESFVSLNATLNSIEPLRPPKPNNALIESSAGAPDYVSTIERQAKLQRQIPPKTYKFNCDKCAFITSNKKDYNRHLITAKHKTTTNDMEISNLPLKNPLCEISVCYCGKEYKYHSGLWRHKQKCSILPPSTESGASAEEFVLENTLTSVEEVWSEPEPQRMLGVGKRLNSVFPQEEVEGVDVNLILELLKQNQEFKCLIIEQNKNMFELAKLRS